MTQINNLPIPEYVVFLNRESERRQLRELLSPEFRPHLVAICGMGGVGKTALAHQAASESATRDEFDAYVWLTAKTREFRKGGAQRVPDNVANLEGLLDTIIRIFGLDAAGYELSEKRNKVMRLLKTRQGALIVADNVEALDDHSAAEVLNFLRYSIPSPSKVIVTSRLEMHGRGEVLIDLDGLSLQDAQELVRHELGIRGWLVRLGQHDMADIYQLTEGNPLTIKYIIGRLGVRRSNMGKVLSDLRSARTSSLLEYLFRESYRDLSGQARLALAGMSVLPRFPADGVTLSHVADLSREQAIRALDELDLLSLVEKDEQGLYSMHPLTLAFAKAELRKDPSLQSLLEGRLKII